MCISYTLVPCLCTRVCTYRRGLRVVGSNFQGNARASKGGTDKSRTPRFFYMHIVLIRTKNNNMKRLTFLLSLICSLSLTYANECVGWNVRQTQSSTTLCNSQTLNFDVVITHDSLTLDSCKYEWYIKSSVSSSHIMFSSSKSTSYAFSDFGDYWIYAKVTPNACPSVHTDTIVITRYIDLTPGTIDGSDIICHNSTPSPLKQVVPPTGGNGVYTYQWQQKSATSWLDISGATSTSYSPSALTNTTTYRLKITNDCGIVYSNEQTITVRPALSAPIISDLHETICYGALPSPVTVATPAYGGDDDTFTYQWQESKDGISFSNISGATGLSYQPNALVADHYYRVAATSVCGCGSIYSSNITKISVLKDLSISTIGVAPLCYMSRGDIKVTATGAGDDYSYQWQESIDGLVYTDCKTNAYSATYKTPPSSAGTYYYRCIVTPTYGCQSKTSDIITVTVYEDVAPSIISGGDTICYGFIPEVLSVEVPASGGDGKFTYAWMQKVEGTSMFTYIAGANKTTYQPSALTKTTDYKLEITNACGIFESNVIQVYVRNQLTAPVIVGETDTICYNTTPELMTCTQTAIGGVEDSFVYQWQESKDGQSYTDIQGETNLTYQPDALLAKRYYRLQATSDKQCGILYSNIIEVNVFDSLNITASVVSPICYMTSASLSVNVEGGGSPYAYQWQQSADGVSFTDITDGVSSNHITPSLSDGTYYYRCVVTSTKCGVYSRFSNVVRVDVYEALSPGTIIGIDSTCYGYAPEGELRIKTASTGVNGRYTYRWQQRTSGNWDTIPNAVNSTYSPPALYETTEYRLQVFTQCDTSYTNIILVRVNALPETQEISGATEVCYNQHEIYSIDNLHKGYTYQWYVDNNYGILTTESLNTKSVDILWNDPKKQDSVVLVIINNKTGCERTMKYGVNICNEQAPDRTTIVRKPNSNILLCQEDRDIHYQWGYTDKTTQTEYTIDDSNRRYVLLPSSFDNMSYDYWLTLRYDTTSKCYSRSYYVEENDTIITQTGNVVSVPSLIHGRIPIIVQNDKEENVTVEIYTICGQLYGRQSLGNASYVDTTLPFVLPSGVYTLRAQIGTYVKTIKLIAQ